MNRELADTEIQDEETAESADLVLFQAKECYVYLIPPRKSTASYRADEWNINKWNWEGVVKVISKGEQCTIRLEDRDTGELYAQAPVRGDQPLPIEAVIDSSRFFVLRIEDNYGPQTRHAFIGIGFRERIPAYDFQAAIYDHMKYLNKKKQAEELVEEYESKSAVDYRLKDGETIHLNLNHPTSLANRSRSRISDQNVDSSEYLRPMPALEGSRAVPFIAPPPNPAVTFSQKSHIKSNDLTVETAFVAQATSDDVEDDFGDFQTAG